MGFRPDGKVLLGSDGEPDAEAGAGDEEGVGADLEKDVEFEDDRVIDVQAEEDGACGKEEGPCHGGEDGVSD